ncbi:MAG: 30S ribosomal protein S3 [Planctomycetes bacterium HGW-Planctomycetes-1]|nr:MAG: 30S ribosomal protein S3 [Planctomycetes bacterium HGW-Planctomycetes-1]
MGQKVQPIGFRTGIRLPWQSTWFAPKASYGQMLVEDQRVRKYIDDKFNKQPPFAAVSKVEIARTRNEVKVTLHTARPGMVIGPRGAEVDKLRQDLETLINRQVAINVIEIKEPALDARLAGEAIAEQMKKRVAFRRAMKQQCELAMQAGAKGVKVICSGRLGGAEMARKETQMEGSIPLHTIDADVDYAAVDARTTYGIIGIKVWIYKGKYGTKLEPNMSVKKTLRRPRSARKTPRAEAAPSSRAAAESKPQQAPENSSAAKTEKKTKE